MKKVIFVLMLLIILLGCKKADNTDDYAGGNMQYDSFRGSSSSIANRVQLEAFDKCMDKFDFNKYKGKTVDIKIYAANDHVTEQIKNLVNIQFIKNSIQIPKQENSKSKSMKCDYSLEVNAICGGYLFYPGIIFHHYESTARVIVLEKTLKDETHYYDSGYQEASIFKAVFTDEFRSSVYIIFFLFIGLLLLRYDVMKGFIKKT